MKAEVIKLLEDILESINSIESYIGDKNNYFEYTQNKMLRRAIERELEIIGEALNRIDKIDKNIVIPNKFKIISLRNRVIHGYDHIDNEIIWGILIRHIPQLKKHLQIILRNI